MRLLKLQDYSTSTTSATCKYALVNLHVFVQQSYFQFCKATTVRSIVSSFLHTAKRTKLLGTVGSE